MPRTQLLPCHLRLFGAFIINTVDATLLQRACLYKRTASSRNTYQPPPPARAEGRAAISDHTHTHTQNTLVFELQHNARLLQRPSSRNKQMNETRLKLV